MKEYSSGYSYKDVINMDYFLFLEHIYYLDVMEAEKNLERLRISDNKNWLQTGKEGMKNYHKLYNYYQSIISKVKKVKIINLFNQKKYDDFFKKYKTPKK